ncbi:Uncharacterised protein r2_g2249 [Pycnogonum litorale]
MKAFKENQASLCDKTRIPHLKISPATVERLEEYADKRALIRNAGEFDKRIRIITRKEMRERTERVCRGLPEVVAKNEAKKRQEEYRTNRMAAAIYHKKVQEKALRCRTRTTVYKKSCISQ